MPTARARPAAATTTRMRRTARRPARPTIRAASSRRRSAAKLPPAWAATPPTTIPRFRATTGRPRSSGATRRLTAGDKWLGYGTVGPTAVPVVQGRHARLPALLPVRRGAGHRQREPGGVCACRPGRGGGTLHAHLDRRLRHGADGEPHLCGGDDQLRELVRLLPHAAACGEDGNLAHVPRQDSRHAEPRRPVPRRLPYDVQLRDIVRRHRRLRRDAEGRLGHAADEPQSSARPGNADAEHDLADRRVLPERQQSFTAGIYRPDRPVVSEELAYVLYRRIHQPELAARHHRRRHGRYPSGGSVADWRHRGAHYRAHSRRRVAARRSRRT